MPLIGVRCFDDEMDGRGGCGAKNARCVAQEMSD